jgi:hypothetical protein
LRDPSHGWLRRRVVRVEAATRVLRSRLLGCMGLAPRRAGLDTPVMQPKAKQQLPRPAETSLYTAVKRHLEGLGFEPKGEICGCDIVAVRAGEPAFLVVAEMKLGLTLELLLQAADRMAVADEVWLAVRATTRGRDRDARVHKLCRRLGLGLLSVQSERGTVEVLVEPGPYRLRRDMRRRSQLLEEHRRRQGDPTRGGSSRKPIMTAYRQRALFCATALQSGPQPTRALRTGVPDAATILRRNVYGWFEREARGVYRLTPAGVTALARWSSPEPETILAI